MKKCSNCENIINNNSVYCQNCEKNLCGIPNGSLKNGEFVEDNPFAKGLPAWDVVPPETVVVRRKRKI